jgi:hypothetical protein
MVIGLYALIALHVYAYFGFIVVLLKKRLGTWGALGWLAIGLIILYNIVFNHILAVIVKPNSPKDLRKVENLREIYKRRSNRKSIQKELASQKADDRFDGLS